MLHEILLALSGHPSILFSDEALATAGPEAMPLSPSEKALLRSIGQLSELHRNLRQHIDRIVLKHSSIICRAAATAIQQTHLPRFQDKIIQVEKKILTKDASIVGAYDIVPLAAVVGEFDDWHRKMAWYWDVACFMQPPENSKESTACTGAALVDKLRTAQHTGFLDIQALAGELSIVAETAWLRQVASWVLYGRVSKFGAGDFFTRLDDEGEKDQCQIVKQKELLPKFVTPSTASSILFIGKSLYQVQKYGKQSIRSSNHATSEAELVARHLQQLSSLTLPIVSAQLTRTISAIRLSLSQNVLQHLLPLETVLNVLSCVKDFFLLGRGEFAVALINEADTRLQARQQAMRKLLHQDTVKALQGLSIKDAELHQTLSSTWKTLAAVDDDIEDDPLDFARKHVTLSTPIDQGSRPSTSDSIHAAAVSVSTVAFNDLLFPNATFLSLRISPPLDLFMSSHEVETYSLINAYLLAIRRAQLRLSELWRRTGARRDQISPSSNGSQPLLPDIRARAAKRNIAMRKTWATCSAAIFLVSEISAYLEGEVIKSSWEHFEAWVKTPESDDGDAEGTGMKRGSSTPSPSDHVVQRDPETLASGHRTFLAALTYALLLNDVPYTRELRSLLGNIDHLIAFFHQLLDAQQKLDVENDSGGAAGYTIEEERRMALELDRARKKVDSDLKSVVNRLRQLDQERIGSARYLDVGSADSGFEAFKSGGIDRLLMKLEFGRVVEGGYDIV